MSELDTEFEISGLGSNDSGECEIASMMVMAGYLGDLNLDVLFSFLPVPDSETSIEELEEGQIASVKRGEGIRGIVITDKKPFPHSLTVYIKINKGLVNIVLWAKKHQHDETGLQYCNAKICGIKDIDTASRSFDMLLDRIREFTPDLEFFVENFEASQSVIEWFQQHLLAENSEMSLIDGELVPNESNYYLDACPEEFLKTQPAESKHIMEFVGNYVSELTDSESFITGFKWLLEQDIRNANNLDQLFLNISLLNMTFFLPFPVDYVKVRDNMNDMYNNHFQRDFFACYLKNQDPNCVVHGVSPNPEKIFIFQVWTKSDCTRVMIKSPGFNPEEIIDKFWKLMMNLRRYVEAEYKIDYEADYGKISEISCNQNEFSHKSDCILDCNPCSSPRNYGSYNLSDDPKTYIF